MDSKNSWLLDESGDVVIGKGITLADYDKTIAQRIQNKIALQYGEWFLHNQEGVRWFSVNDLPGVFGRKVAEINLDTQIKEYVENDKDVERITEYKTNFTDKGDYKIDIGILTKNSEVIFF